MELTPFYYDKRKELHKPGEYFDVDMTNKGQCILRSGRAIPYSNEIKLQQGTLCIICN